MNENTTYVNNANLRVLAKLTKVQTELKCAKSRKNDYGDYNYRNAEDILHEVKPLNDKYNLSLVLEDHIEHIGDIITAYPDGRRVQRPNCYVTAKAILTDVESGEKVVVTASACEGEPKGGMSAAQASGSASSYARKYCLSALYLISSVDDDDDLSARGYNGGYSNNNYNNSGYYNSSQNGGYQQNNGYYNGGNNNNGGQNGGFVQYGG